MAISSKARAIVVCVVASGVMAWPAHGASAQEPPPDDGAPPSDDVPMPGAEIADVLVTADQARTLAVEDPALELPKSPPVDNAFPIRGYLGSCANNFGVPRSPDRLHEGVDCFAPLGTPLVAVETGSIRYATPGEAFSCATGGDISGNRVSVRGESGYVYYYGHLDTIAVATDQLVQKGQVIGTVGRTGNASCSTSHLHFEVKCGENGEPFDPYPPMTTWGRTILPRAPWPVTAGQGVGASFSGTTRQDVFALECRERIRQKTAQRNRIPSGWTARGGAATSDPDATSAGPGYAAEVFVRGGDNAVWQMWQGGLVSLGGSCSSGPAAAFSATARLDVFCVGTDGAVYQRTWVAGRGWYRGWFTVGGAGTSDPDAAWPGPGYLPQVFVRGQDNAVWQMWWDGKQWIKASLGGSCTSGPSAAYSGPTRLDVFCRGGDLSYWHKVWTASRGWTAWMRIEGWFLSDPEAVSAGPGGVAQLIGRGLDRRLYNYVWNGRRWVTRMWGLT
jgi:hypothetical protein